MRTETREALELIDAALKLEAAAERATDEDEAESLKRQAARARIEAEHAIARLA